VKLRTELDIQKFLDNEFAWRIKEIDYTQTAVKRASGNAQSTLTRAGVALLYAHWEGFVKRAAEAFLNFVRYRNLKYRELKVCFIAHGITHHLEILSSSQKHDRRNQVVQFVLNQLDEPARFAWRDVIRTQGNLSSHAFRNVAAAIGIDPTPYETRFNWIDQELLAKRNQVAHGDWLEVAPEHFPGLAAETITLLRWFKTDIENSIALKTYLAITPADRTLTLASPQ
jgi:hypothetical protein